MKIYVVTQKDAVITNQLIDAFPMGVGGTLQLSSKDNKDTIAKARWANVRNLGDVYAERGSFSKKSQFAYVSGLTHCIGIIIVEKGTSGNEFSKVSVAHYNWGWKKTSGIEDQKAFFGSGKKYGLILASAATNGDDMKKLKEEFQRRLINFGIPDNNVLFYHSASDLLCFGICADCTIGEIVDPHIVQELC